jgi:hypothetical protein
MSPSFISPPDADGEWHGHSGTLAGALNRELTFSLLPLDFTVC